MRRLRRAALAAVLLVAGGFGYARYWWGPGPEALERERRAVHRLAQQLEARLREQARLRDGAGESVLVGIPAGVAERLAGEALGGLGSGIRVELRDLRFRKADELRARLLAGRRTIGRFVLSLHVLEVHALLRPAPPRLSFEADRVRLALPVVVADGAGRARLRFKWDGRGMAGAVCGDLEVTRELAASVPRRTHTLEGSIRLALDGDGTGLVARPELGDVELRLPIEPSAEAWRFVDEVIAGRGALCRAALGRVDVPAKLRALLARGIRVKIPRRVLERELRVPVAVAREVSVPGGSLRLLVRPNDLVLAPDRLWYGANVELAARGSRPPP